MRKKNRAVALVVVLSVIVILTIIVISMAVAMRLERQAAFYFSERSRADLMAREGVEMAKILLNDAFATNNFAVSMPGRLLVVRGENPGAWTNVELSSGPAAAGSGVFSPADMNRTNKTGDGLRQIDPNGAAMTVSWVYVHQNGERTTNASPTISTNNPIIGRYAFWVDDESTRINLNTSHKRDNNPYILSQVEIEGISDVITESDTDSIFSQTKNRPLQSVQEIFRIKPNLSATLSTNRFFATHYSHSSDLNPWGEPKIVLTTQSNRAYGRPFLDILNNPTSDPGGNVTTTINSAKLSDQLVKITELLQRTNWPLFPGKSFAQKFKAADQSRITQLALDIIDYVRSAESTNNSVSLLRVIPSGSGYAALNSVAANTFLGTSRHPLITEVGTWVANTPNASTNYDAIGVFEVYLPPHYGITSYPLVGDHVSFSFNTSTNATFNGTITAAMTTKATLGPGEYAVVTTPVMSVPQTNRPANTTRVRVTLANPANNLYEDAANATIVIPPDAAGTNNLVDTIRTAEVDDPRLNKNPANWVLRAAGTGNTLGAQNSIWKTAPAQSPVQDKDGAVYSDYSLSMPPPKGAPGNEDGKVVSVAELGRVTTGFDKVTNTAAPWRTVRLRPTSTGDTDIPDWALLELFAAPLTPTPGTEPLYFPSTNSLSGRINLNTTVTPYGTNKMRALRALVGPGHDTIITNILNHTLASGGRDFGSTEFYKSIGELAEIQGVSDSGEQSEEFLHKIASQSTVRSGVFRVYCTGQSLQQTPTGNLIINATKSVEALLDCADPANPRFRSVTWQENPL